MFRSLKRSLVLAGGLAATALGPAAMPTMAAGYGPAPLPTLAAGLQVTACSDINFGGTCQTFTSSVPNLIGSSVRNDSISSLRVQPGTFVGLYSDINYGGVCQKIAADVPSLFGSIVGNDAASSIKVTSDSTPCGTIPGYQTVSKTVSVPGWYGIDREMVHCPAGQVVLGGGAVPTGLAGNSDGLLVFNSGVADTQAWAVELHNFSILSQNVTVSVECANPLPGYQLVSQTLTMRGQDNQDATVHCPAGQLVLGGGALPTGLAPENHSLGDNYSGVADGRTWAVNVYDGSPNIESATVTAVCANLPPGYQTVSKNVGLWPEIRDKETVQCPTGTVVLGGGAVPTGLAPANDALQTFYSGPADTRTWAVAIGSMSAISATVTAVCGDAS